LAYLEGIKQYTDNNANNQFDSGTDVATDQGDAYRDDNEDGIYNAGEFVVSRGGVTVCAGNGGSAPSRANTCTGTNVVASTVRNQSILLFASKVPLASVPAGQGPYNAGAAAQTMNILLNGDGTTGNLLPMPAGTTVSVESLKTGCTVSGLTPVTVGLKAAGTDPLANIGTTHNVTLTGTATVNCQGGQLKIKTTTPSGHEDQKLVTIP
jgi:hypothetical protein